MRKQPVLFVLLIVGALVATVAPASAATLEFFADGDASAGWVEFAPAPPSATDTFSIALEVNAMSSSDFDDFAGFEVLGFDPALPATAPSFDFYSTDSNAGSGGSPRITLVFDNGGVADLRPLSWTAGSWVTIDGADPMRWDVRGTCSFIFNATYADVGACEAGSGVARFIVVSDSGWFNPGGYIHYIDNVTYGDLLISAPPTTCGDPDGDGDNHSNFAPDQNEDGPLSGALHGIDQALVVPVVTDDGGVVPEVNCAVVKGVLGL